jgi:thymidylate synthase (FAD)
MNSDKWRYLRDGLFRNTELLVELVAITKPVGKYRSICTSETLPAFTARASHESKGTIKDDERLNKDLIKLGHTTPLQAVQFVFYINGISKSLQNQWVRHKIGIGWTFRSTRYISANENAFVYCTYDYIENEKTVMELLHIDDKAAENGIYSFDAKRKLGASKQDSRKIMPVFWNTPCYCYVNARELRHLFSLRLKKAAEWEIRRLHREILRIVKKETPSLFEDF